MTDQKNQTTKKDLPSYAWLANEALVEKVKEITGLVDVSMTDQLICQKLYEITRDKYRNVSGYAAYDVYLVDCEVMNRPHATISLLNLLSIKT